jgi:hypothetical protein
MLEAARAVAAGAAGRRGMPLRERFPALAAVGRVAVCLVIPLRLLSLPIAAEIDQQRKSAAAGVVVS